MNTHPNGYWLDPDGHYKDDALALSLAVFFGPGTTVLDIGCGSGNYVKILNKCGVKCRGVDGNPHTPHLNGLVAIADITTPLSLGKFDWVLSLEVGEHIPESHCAEYLCNLDAHCRKGIVLSWAIPGQGGQGHVNERPNEWVRNMLKRIGYTPDFPAQDALRKEASVSWFNNTLMVFRKDQ